MIHPVPNYDHHDVDRYIAEARALRSREFARLLRALFHAPRRLLRNTQSKPAELEQSRRVAGNA